MITVSVDPVTGRLAFISLPRDTSNIPLPRDWPAYRALGGKWNNKINTLYTVARSRPDLFPGNDKQRGYKALMGTLGQLYGLDIKYYMAVDLNSFRSVVNTLGGADPSLAEEANRQLFVLVDQLVDDRRARHERGEELPDDEAIGVAVGWWPRDRSSPWSRGTSSCTPGACRRTAPPWRSPCRAPRRTSSSPNSTAAACAS